MTRLLTDHSVRTVGFTITLLLALLVIAGRMSSLAEGEEQQAVDEIAREIAKIQQDLGGSIVEKQFDVEDAQTISSAQRAVVASRSAQSGDPVLVLRESAWKLDAAAHRLESLDLYSQADAVRDLAEKLRQDARQLRADQLAHSE